MLNPNDKKLVREKIDTEILKLRKEKSKYEKLINNNEKILNGYKDNLKDTEKEINELEDLISRLI
jgi:septal ring factor EnvC (AmiA/AmiB activator)